MHRVLRMATSHAATKEGSSRTCSAVRRESAIDNRTSNWSNAIQKVRRSNDRHTKSIPADTGRKNTQQIKHKSFTNIVRL